MRKWADTMREAFDRSRPVRKRLGSALDALTIARARAPGSAYHCRSLQALARASADDAISALRALDEAALICAAAHGGDDIRLAQIRLDRARLLYRTGRPDAAWAAAEGLEAIFAAYGQEERLTALYDLQAAALRAKQQIAHSTAARMRAGAWGAFALGRDSAMLQRWTQD